MNRWISSANKLKIAEFITENTDRKITSDMIFNFAKRHCSITKWVEDGMMNIVVLHSLFSIFSSAHRMYSLPVENIYANKNSANESLANENSAKHMLLHFTNFKQTRDYSYSIPCGKKRYLKKIYIFTPPVVCKAWACEFGQKTRIQYTNVNWDSTAFHANHTNQLGNTRYISNKFALPTTITLYWYTTARKIKSETTTEFRYIIQQIPPLKTIVNRHIFVVSRGRQRWVHFYGTLTEDKIITFKSLHNNLPIRQPTEIKIRIVYAQWLKPSQIASIDSWERRWHSHHSKKYKFADFFRET